MNINILRKYKIKDLRGELKEYEEKFLNDLNDLKNTEYSKLFDLSYDKEKRYIFDYLIIKHEQYIRNNFVYDLGMIYDSNDSSYSYFYGFQIKMEE